MSNARTQKTPNSKPKESRALPNSVLTLWSLIASLGILSVGLYRAIALRWICDDAFITMRYVKNFLEGHGLVYNVGERVEGYTHFLWLLMVAAAQAVGFDPVDASIWLGIASYTGILFLLLVISHREWKKRPKAIWLPLAAALFALNYDTAVWASGGLETSFYTFLLVAAFSIWFYSKFSERSRLVLVGVALALATLTRPDGVLFVATATGLLVAHSVKRRQPSRIILRTTSLLLLPCIIIGMPYLIWKYFYYGDLLPLTYYAKSGDNNYFGQGFFYVWLYFRVYFTSAIALVVGTVLLLRYHRTGIDQTPGVRSNAGSPTWTALAAVVAYLLLFVARVGGDFMFARFIIPVVPFVFFIIERALDQLPVRTLKYRAAIALLLLASVLIENKLRYYTLFHLKDNGDVVENWNLVGEGSTHGVADERWAYYEGHFVQEGKNRGTLDVYSEIGQYLEPFFRGLPVTVAIPGAENMIAYYGNFQTCINEYGLTDKYIAHLPAIARKRIGHEKSAPEEYLVRRNVEFELGDIVSVLPKPLGATTLAFELPTLGLWQLARLVTYNKTIMGELADRFTAAGNESRLPLYEKIIPQYVEEVLPNAPLNQIEEAYAGLRQYYFSRYPDTAMQRRFEEQIAELQRDSATHPDRLPRRTRP